MSGPFYDSDGVYREDGEGYRANDGWHEAGDGKCDSHGNYQPNEYSAEHSDN